MNSVTEFRRKHRSSPRQPLDRHLSEIGEFDGTIYINAGIDSTWFDLDLSLLISFISFYSSCQKRTQAIYKLTDGIVVSTSNIKPRNSTTNVCCEHCGK